MKNLRPKTLGLLQRIETLSGRPVEFKPDVAADNYLERSG
jgi:hypothetical protein